MGTAVSETSINQFQKKVFNKILFLKDIKRKKRMVKIEDENQEKKEEERDNEASKDESTRVSEIAPEVNLPEMEVPTGEEEEQEIFKIRAKLFRFDTLAEPPEWKERGTGDVKLMTRKTDKGKIRLLMRRDKTLKICANHFVQPWMILKPMKGSDRALMWLVQADFADEEPKAETLAIRFASAENTKKFKDAFDSAILQVTEWEADRITRAEEAAAAVKRDTKEKDLEKDGDAQKEFSKLSINDAE